jgi:BirA family biotin operon repressor/biotin-[acetyl-CoA-carboxylase] ligase
MDRKIAACLLEHPGQTVSREYLAQQTGLDLADLELGLARLREQRVLAVTSDREGVRCEAAENDLEPSLVEYLNDSPWGRPLFFSDQIGSTNDWAKQQVKTGVLKEGALFAARFQSGGRGRHGRHWVSPRGGLWFTLVLRPTLPASFMANLSLVFGLMVARVLSRYYPDIKVKWPNDVWAGGRKIVGILLEMVAGFDRIDYIVAGIGINVNNRLDSLSPEVREHSATLIELTGENSSHSLLLARLLAELSEGYQTFMHAGFGAFYDEYLQRLANMGEPALVRRESGEIAGTCVGITAQGELLLKTESGGIMPITSGEVVFLR